MEYSCGSTAFNPNSRQYFTLSSFLVPKKEEKTDLNCYKAGKIICTAHEVTRALTPTFFSIANGFLIKNNIQKTAKQKHQAKKKTKEK